MFVETLLQDIRYSARTLSRNLGFTVVAVFALALGVGVNTAAFTAYKAMIARPIDAREPATMVNMALIRSSGATDATFSYPDYETYRDSLQTLDVIAESHKLLTVSHTSGTGTTSELVLTFMVSEDYFSVLGVKAIRGQTFDTMKVSDIWATPPVLISEKYWEENFSRNPDILGKTIQLNRITFTIAGVTPRGFVGTFVSAPDLWIPLRLATLVHADENWLRNPENWCCRMFARLAPNVALASAEVEMQAVTTRMRSEQSRHPTESETVQASVWMASPFPAKLNGGLKLAVVAVMVAAGMVLLVACANVASLQLARATSRQHELSVRLSLGASPTRIIRQLLTENVLVALVAGALALFITWFLLRAAVTVAANAFPAEYGTLIFDVAPDLGIFTYVFLLSVAAGIVAGLAPALESSRSNLKAVRGGSMQRRWLQKCLVAAQVAVSAVLLIGGSLFVRSAMRSLAMATGYETSRLVSVDLRFPEWRKFTHAQKRASVDTARTRASHIPGVGSITSARAPTANAMPRRAFVSLDGRTPSADSKRTVLYYTYVEANYFRTLGIRLLSGAGFSPQAGDSKSVVVSDSAARELWPGQNPIGQTLRLGTEGHSRSKKEPLPDGPVYQVIGVVGDTRGFQLDRSDSRQVYLRIPEDALHAYPLLVRTESEPTELIKSLDATIASVDPDLTASIQTLDSMLRQTPAFVISTAAAAGASSIGLMGLLLACMGLYGTVTFLVALRTREVGIRIAIGAQKADILSLIVRESMRPVVAGLTTATLVSIGASYLLRAVFYGMGAVDAWSFAAVCVLFSVSGLAAIYPPCRRAMRVDPMVALRHD